jgi:hypothetical protein
VQCVIFDGFNTCLIFVCRVAFSQKAVAGPLRWIAVTDTLAQQTQRTLLLCAKQIE